MKLLNKYWPKEIGVPYRLFVSKSADVYKYLNYYNGIKTIYYSLYNCDLNKNYSNCNVDKIHFDLDKDNAFTSLNKLHKYCKKNNYKHLMIFTGRKYQFYIFTKNYIGVVNRKAALKNAQKYIANECNLTIGDPKVCDIDFHLIGDIARLVRLPNSIHLTTNLYCISLTTEDISKSESFIQKKAKHTSYDFTYYGLEYFDILKFDTEKDDIFTKILVNENILNIINDNNFLKTIPICISNMLLSEYVCWRMRFHIIIYLREMGFCLNDAYKILEKYLSGKKHPQKGHDNYWHAVKEESNQIRRLYKTDNYFFSCRKILEEGYCIDGCEKKVYK